MSALRHGHVEAAHPRRASCALSMWRNQNRSERCDQFARAIRDWRSRLHGDARSEPACEQFATGRFGGGELLASRDRKSTRLNSSHVAISYAVFCLKKKKTGTK